MVENLIAMWETRVRSLGWEDRSPGEGTGNPLQYFCLENPMDRGAWQTMGLQKVGHDWATTWCDDDNLYSNLSKKNVFLFLNLEPCRKVYHFCAFQCYLEYSIISDTDIVSNQFNSVQLLSPDRLFVTPWTAAHQTSLSITNSQSLLKLVSIELVMPSNHLILCHPLLLPPSIFPNIRVFSNESVLHIRWPKYWSFSFNITPSNEHSGLISFRIDWLDLLAVQGTLKRLLQHHSSKASILQCSDFFIVQLSYPISNTKLLCH